MLKLNNKKSKNQKKKSKKNDKKFYLKFVKIIFFL